MYSQLTTGSKTHVISKIKSDSSAVHVDLGLDTLEKIKQPNQMKLEMFGLKMVKRL